ncbi:HEPN domain-containing protein [Puteibacter caeruleilacunae]|nr:HEPN domain-containing protein [Puteibacter caeruleilacunae]
MNYTLDQQTLIRVKRAWEFLEKADEAVSDHDLNEMIINLYRACFSIIQAHLFHSKITVKNHDDLKIYFHENYVRKGLIPLDTEKIYAKLYILRRQILEEDIEFLDESKCTHYTRQTQLFVSAVGKLIKSD